MAISMTAAGKLSAVKNNIDLKEKERKNYPKATVRLSKELDEAVHYIIENSEDISTPSQALRQALVVYHTLFTQMKQGNVGGVMMKSGEFIPIFDDKDFSDVST